MVHIHMWRCILFLFFQNSLALITPASGRCQASPRSSSLSGYVSLDMVTTSCHNAVSSTSFSSILYSGKLSRENFCKLVKNTIFTERSFADCSLLLRQRTPCPKILQRKLSRMATQPRNLRKFSPSKVFRYMVELWCVTSLMTLLALMIHWCNAWRAHGQSSCMIFFLIW